MTQLDLFSLENNLSEDDFKSKVYELASEKKLMIHEDGRWKMAKNKYFNNILTTATFTWENAFSQIQEYNKLVD